MTNLHTSTATHSFLSREFEMVLTNLNHEWLVIDGQVYRYYTQRQCCECGHVFETDHTHFSIDFDTEHYAYVDCPLCNNEHTVSLHATNHMKNIRSIADVMRCDIIDISRESDDKLIISLSARDNEHAFVMAFHCALDLPKFSNVSVTGLFKVQGVLTMNVKLA